MQNKITRGKEVSSLRKAYLAGLLDADGCINIYRILSSPKTEKRKVPKYVLSVTIYNCHYPTIKWLHDTFGGYLQTRNRNEKTWRTNYAWKLNSNKASDFLLEIQEYMLIKSEQAKVAIKFQDEVSRYHGNKKGKPKGMSEKDHSFREKCWLKLKELNSPPATTK